MSQGCYQTPMGDLDLPDSVGGLEKLMKVNVNVVKGVQGHAPLLSFESLGSQKCHLLHSESLSCFMRQQEFFLYFLVSVVKPVKVSLLCRKI